MGTGDILLGGNPAMDKHPVQGGVAILLGMLNAKETGMSAGGWGLWLMCAFTFLIYHSSNYDSVNKTFSSCDHLSSICIILLSVHYGTVYFYNPAQM